MRRKRVFIPMIVFLFAAGLMATGCKKEDDAQAKDGKKKKNQPAATEVELTKIEVDSLKMRVEKEKGNVVVVDFWATT